MFQFAVTCCGFALGRIRTSASLHTYYRKRLLENRRGNIENKAELQPVGRRHDSTATLYANLKKGGQQTATLYLL